MYGGKVRSAARAAVTYKNQDIFFRTAIGVKA